MNEVSAFPGLSLRQPPANLRAEQSVLGAIMCNPKALNLVVEMLRPEHFADALHGRIFAEQRRRILDGGIADAVALKAWFEADSDAEMAGGFDYLAGLVAAYVGPGTVVPYAEVIRDTWQRREVIGAAEIMIADAFAQSGPTASQLISETITRIEAVAGNDQSRPVVSLDGAVDAAIDAMEQARKRGGPAGLSTGFAGLDEFLGGMEDGTLHVLAGRPGMGKSALGWQIALAVAALGIGVVAISLEMSAQELGRRALAVASGVPIWVMRKGMASTEHGERLVLARKKLRGLPLSIEDGSGLTAAMIAMKVRAAHRRHGVGLVMVDHLHIVRPEDADVRQGATWAVGRISGAMKRLAKDMRCPVLLLAQLNRGVEGRDDKRPALGDLRQSGDIEQDADSVAFVYRPEYYLKGEPERLDGDTAEKWQSKVADYHDRKESMAGKAEVIFAKIRDGSPGTAHLRFCGETASFTEEAYD